MASSGSTPTAKEDAVTRELKRLCFHTNCVDWKSQEGVTRISKRPKRFAAYDMSQATGRAGRIPKNPNPLQVLTGDEADAFIASLNPIEFDSNVDWMRFDAMIATLGDDTLSGETISPASTDVAPTGIATSGELPSTDVDLSWLTNDVAFDEFLITLDLAAFS